MNPVQTEQEEEEDAMRLEKTYPGHRRGAARLRPRRALAALPLALALLAGCSSPADEPSAAGQSAAASALPASPAGTSAASPSSAASPAAAPAASAAVGAAGKAPAGSGAGKAAAGAAPAARPSGAPAAAPAASGVSAKPDAAKPRASAKPAQKPVAGPKAAEKTAAPAGGADSPRAAASPRPAAASPAARSVTLSVTGGSGRGVILPPTEVEIKEGDSVLEVLKKLTRKKKIQMEFRGSGALGYVEGIDNLYELDEGPESGWLFSVNGEFPDKSAGAYTLKPGDSVEWRYTLDGGKDVGKTR